MANKSGISAASLTPNVRILVDGYVTFSRIASIVDGKELLAEQNNPNIKFPQQKPYTRLVISRPTIIPRDPAGQLSREEQYIQGAYYTSTKTGEVQYSITNPSKFLPTIIQSNEQGTGKAKQIALEDELAAGLHVRLMLHTYKPQKYANLGISLDAVILMEPVKYFSDHLRSTLAEYGIDYEPMSQTEKNAVEEKSAQAARERFEDAENKEAPPIEAPTGNAFMNTPEPAAPAAAPAANQNPNPVNSVPEATCAHCGAVIPANQMFCGNCGMPRANAPAPAAPANNNAGIRYTP